MGERYWVWLAARLLAGIALVAWAFSYLTPSRSGEKEFQKALDATKQVRTVRVAETADPSATQHSDLSYELVCSQSAFHFTWHMAERDPERPAEFTRDELQVGVLPYRRAADGSWEKDANLMSTANADTLCKLLSQEEKVNFLPDFKTMIQRGIIQKADKKTVNGVRCREWKVTLKGGVNLEHDTVCLGVDDHLPYEMTVDWTRSRSTYNYDSSFQLELPAAEVQQTNATSN